MRTTTLPVAAATFALVYILSGLEQPAREPRVAPRTAVTISGDRFVFDGVPSMAGLSCCTATA